VQVGFRLSKADGMCSSYLSLGHQVWVWNDVTANKLETDRRWNEMKHVTTVGNKLGESVTGVSDTLISFESL